MTVGPYKARLGNSPRLGNGPTGQTAKKLMPLRSELLRISTESDKPKKKVLKGRKTILTDDQVREARQLFEQGGKTASDIAKIFHLTDEYAYKLVNYQTRSKVIP